MTRHTAIREFDVMDGKAMLSSGEARYTFSVMPGRAAVTWANASGGFSPAERPGIDLHGIEIRMNRNHPWCTADSFAFDMLVSDVPDEWFLAQIEEAAE
jgi:hypothetical protein